MLKIKITIQKQELKKRPDDRAKQIKIYQIMSINKKNSQAHDIVITEIGLCCVTGQQPFALFGALGGNIINSRELGIEVASPDPDEAAISPLCVSTDMVASENPTERIMELAATALGQIFKKIDREIDHSKILCCILLPAVNEARGTAINEIYTENYLNDWIRNRYLSVSDLNTSFGAMNYRFVRVDQGAAKALSECCQELAEGKWQAVIFGGADSLINEVTCAELASEARLNAKDNPNGQIPGEGAAFLLLEVKQEENETENIEISNVIFKPEPNTRCAEHKKLLGLADSISEIIKKENISPNAIDTILLPFGLEICEQLEWYQVQQKIWPRVLDESQRLAMQTGEVEAPQPEPETIINPEILPMTSVTGNLGAATLPIALALSCGRFEYNYPNINNLIVCDASSYAIRGAVYLNQNSKQKHSPKQAA
ncbi:MAG: hypothetical protein ACC635_00995 [Acidiferrobacterales bacterium]